MTFVFPVVVIQTFFIDIPVPINILQWIMKIK